MGQDEPAVDGEEAPFGTYRRPARLLTICS
jgi:hypothetical protein